MKIATIVVSALIASAFGLTGTEEKAPAPSAPQPAAHDYKIDTGHSSAIFRIKHAGAAYFYGRFDKVEGTASLDPASLDAAKFDVSIAADSVWTGNENRNKHLRGPDFFDVKQFPAITFKGEGAKKIEKDVYELKGTLSMHGVEKPATVRATYTGTGQFRGQRWGYEAKFTVKRSDFDMNYGIAQKVLGDEVDVTVGLELVAAK